MENNCDILCDIRITQKIVLLSHKNSQFQSQLFYDYDLPSISFVGSYSSHSGGGIGCFYCMCYLPHDPML